MNCCVLCATDIVKSGCPGSGCREVYKPHLPAHKAYKPSDKTVGASFRRGGACTLLTGNDGTGGVCMEHAAHNTGHKPETKIYEYVTSAVGVLSVPGALVLAGWDAPDFGKLCSGPVLPDLSVIDVAIDENGYLVPTWASFCNSRFPVSSGGWRRLRARSRSPP